MVIIVRSNDIVSDPRVEKYIKFLDDKHLPYQLIGWDRDGVMESSDNAVYLKRRAGHNVGGIKAIKGRIVWMWFVFCTLRNMNLRGVTLHACDLDAAFPCAVYKFLTSAKRNIKLIFDIFDWYSDTIPNQNALIRWAFALMERVSVRLSDYLIICEPERREQIPFSFDDSKLTVLPNIPYFSDSSFLTEMDSPLFDNDKITFCYIGGFIVKRCLEDIISIAERGEINLAIGGFGSKEIEGRLEDLKDHPNIKYYGKVKYQDGLRIMYNSDIVYAMYSPEIKNNIYAAPNKFYESMFVGKALFTTLGTKVGEKTVQLGMGYVAKDNEEDIMQVIRTIDPEEMRIRSKKSSDLWKTKYCNYTADFMEHEYRGMIS